MDHRQDIEVELVRLATGERLLRLSYSPLALVLEKRLAPSQPLLPQKESLFGVFEAALARAELTAV